MRRSGQFEVLRPGEVAALARAAESEQDAALLVTAAFTGLRLGELLALRWIDVDFAKRLVHVRRAYTHRELGLPKSGRVRSVPLIDEVGRVLDGLSRREHFVAADDLVFPNAVGEPLDYSALRRRFYRALERAGLKRIRFHDLRHSFGTLAVQVFPLLRRQGLHGPRRHPDDNGLRPPCASRRCGGAAVAGGGGFGGPRVGADRSCGGCVESVPR